ncbi:hypothetical protein L1987_19052 [Smallanthus sonchifolius]|uniref:Uncharacterized protein n=1 Tax=Smallanthus sonchifolius TaxID=185202 RepID=A0ACB9J3H9_9ASTR|nr:hypothetical protein L1987_19052 [Smallanthus sonchifolius]
MNMVSSTLRITNLGMQKHEEITQHQGEINIRKSIERTWTKEVKAGSQKSTGSRRGPMHGHASQCTAMQRAKTAPVLPKATRFPHMQENGTLHARAIQCMAVHCQNLSL